MCPSKKLELLEYAYKTVAGKKERNDIDKQDNTSNVDPM